MKEETIKNIIIILIVLMAVWILLRAFSTKALIVEENPTSEHLRNIYENSFRSPVLTPRIGNFFIRDTNDRYRLDNCPCGCKGGCKCGPNCTNCKCMRTGDDPGYHFANAFAPDQGTGIDYGPNAEPEFLPCMQHLKKEWRPPYDPGANNTKGDLLWNYVNPKMILESNCLDCKKWTSPTNFNPPGGVVNDVASQFSNFYPVNPSNEFPISGYDGERPGLLQQRIQQSQKPKQTVSQETH